jgi:hypothetical protein
MRGTTWIWATLAVLGAAPAMAAEEDTQLWLTGSVAVPLGQGLAGTFEVSPRARSSGDQLLSRASLEQEVSERLSLGGAVAYVEFAGGNEFRLHQQALVTAGPLAFRTRVEERWFAGADRPQVRLRQRVAATMPLAQGTRAVLAGELLYIAQAENRGQDDRVDQWRAQATVQHTLSDHLDASMGYLFIYSPRSGAEDRISHVPQLSLTWRPGRL